MSHENLAKIVNFINQDVVGLIDVSKYPIPQKENCIQIGLQLYCVNHVDYILTDSGAMREIRIEVYERN